MPMAPTGAGLAVTELAERISQHRRESFASHSRTAS
jgi:hypothetical protein